MSERTLRRAFLFAFALTLVPLALCAAEKSAAEIVDDSYSHNMMDFDAATADVKMELIEAGKVVETRALRSKTLRTKESGKALRRSLMTFTQPADVSGTAFLDAEKGPGVDDDQFLYLPAVGKPLRKGGKSGKTESFMGTQFTFYDLQSKNKDKSNHVRLADEKLGSSECYVIESTPKPASEDPYGKTVSWIDKKTFIPLRAKLFDKQGNVWKVMLAEKVETIDKKPIITQLSMQDLKSKKATRLTFSNINTKASLTVSDFTKERMSAF